MTEPIIYQDSQYGIGKYDTAGSLRAGRIPEHQMLVEPQARPILAMDWTQGGQATVEYSPTLRVDNGTESRATVTIATGTVVRRLTPLECERLMGWPDEHTRWRADGTEVSDSARYRMCGNGVATPVAAYVAACINRALEQEATDAA